MHSLRYRIFAFFLVLLLVVMGSVLFMVYHTTHVHTQEQIAGQLANGYAVFQSELDTRNHYIGESAGAVTHDFALLEQLASRDANSIAATLESYRSRTNARFVLALDTNYRLIAGTLPKLIPGQVQSFGMMMPTDSPHLVSRLSVYEGQAVQVFIWPIYAPHPNLLAYLVLGYALDDTLMLRMRKLMGIDISLMNDGAVIASSLPATERMELAKEWSPGDSDRSLLLLDQREYAIFSRRWSTATGSGITVLLQRSLTEVLRPYEMLQVQLVGIQIVSLLLAALGAYFIASTISRPLSRMSQYVKHMAQGDYSVSPPEASSQEMEVLTSEFSKMQQIIAEREAAISHLAYRDSLTELANRNAFQEHLGDALKRCQEKGGRLAVLILDIDYFKDVNDTLGHLTGDELLRMVAHRLAEKCRPEDVLARLGGDQFALLLPHIEIEGVNELVQHYRQALQGTYAVEGFSLSLSATGGIAVYPEHGENAVSLLQRAEVAMYVAKKRKIPYAFYDTQLDHNSVLRLALMSELKPAIDRQELTLYYQPKIDIRLSRVIGVECLVRWLHPVHGFIAPDEFIPLAEQTGHIRYLTQWVLRTALQQSRQWRLRGWNLKIAVNISAMDLSDPEFHAGVERLLSEYEVPAETLILEITESAVMDDPEHAIAVLTTLQEMGVHLSIDDYGTGYSSLVQLKRLPVHEIKIDKSFVLDVANNPDDATIVRSTVELGHNMSLSVVAEGVENPACLDFLRAIGCNIAQGYFFSKPVPVSAFEQWLASSPFAGPDVAGQKAVP